MKLSTKGTNAMLALFNMALIYPNKLVSINELAMLSNISPKYLEQIFYSLKRDNIITSKRGAAGGYSFAKPLSRISVYEILCSLEGTMEPVKCLNEVECSRAQVCRTKPIWNAMHTKMIILMKSITLEQLVKDYGDNNETIN
ncbi:MAG: Rrf2 family transcriptional regulator [Erysipelotrichaceae bacterium]